MNQNLKKTIIKIGFSTTLATFAFVLATIIAPLNAHDHDAISAGMSTPISQLAEKTTIGNLKAMAQFEKTPSNLPSSSIKDVYVEKDDSGALITYSNSNLKSIHHIGGADIGSAELVLTIAKESANPIPHLTQRDVSPMSITWKDESGVEHVKYVDQSPADFISINVNGAKGIGLESKDDSSGVIQPATIRWWDNTSLYTLYGYTSVQELVKIAEAIK
jgi:hypothetical protein